MKKLIAITTIRFAVCIVAVVAIVLCVALLAYDKRFRDRMIPMCVITGAVVTTLFVAMHVLSGLVQKDFEHDYLFVKLFHGEPSTLLMMSIAGLFGTWLSISGLHLSVNPQSVLAVIGFIVMILVNAAYYTVVSECTDYIIRKDMQRMKMTGD